MGWLVDDGKRCGEGRLLWEESVGAQTGLEGESGVGVKNYLKYSGLLSCCSRPLVGNCCVGCLTLDTLGPDADLLLYCCTAIVCFTGAC